MKDLAKRLGALVRISYPYEVRSVDVRATKNKIYVNVEYAPLHESMKAYVDNGVSVVIENIMVRHDMVCEWHSKGNGDHSYIYAMA